jgi:alkaline phosphatase D
MYRRLDYGSLVRVHLLDTRQYRTDQICAATETEHCRTAGGEGPSHVLGAEQEAWLGRGLGGGHHWNLIAQQIMVMPFAYPKSRKAGVVNTDSWSGYPDARERLVRAIQQQKLSNVVIATGDVHKHHAGVLPSIEGDLASAPVATEYVCSSISSGGDGTDVPSGWEGVEEQNPHTALVNDKRGYQVFDIMPTTWKTSVMAVESVSARGAPKRKIATLVTEAGRPGVHSA